MLPAVAYRTVLLLLGFFLPLWFVRAHGKTLYAGGLRNLPGPDELDENCVPALDVASVIDVTESEHDKIGTIRREMPLILKSLLSRYPESRLSIATFTDKPIPPLGYNMREWKDYCLDIRTTFESSEKEHMTSIKNLEVAGGYDFPEAQLDALFRTVLTPDLHWRNWSVSPKGNPYVKVAILVTDAFYHTAGEAAKAAEKLGDQNTNYTVTANDLDQMPQILHGDVNIACGDKDYPTIEALGRALKEYNILPIFIVAPAGYTCNDPSRNNLCPFPEQIQKAKETGDSRYEEPAIGMDLLYTDLLKQMNVTGIVQHVGQAFEGFHEKLLKALKDLQKFSGQCSQIPSTTSVPTSTPTTSATAVDLSTTATTVELPTTTATVELPTTTATVDLPTTTATVDLPTTTATAPPSPALTTAPCPCNDPCNGDACHKCHGAIRVEVEIDI